MNFRDSYELEAVQFGTFGLGGRVLGSRAAMISSILALSSVWLRIENKRNGTDYSLYE